jgi:Chaperone of endosialidase
MYRSGIRLNAFGNGNIQFFTDGSSTVASGTAFTPTERMRITDAGNVGIGTASPSGRLNVSTSGPSIIRNQETSVGVNSYWNASDGSLTIFGNVSNHPLTFITNNTERARIDNSGNLLVGVTTPGDGGGGIVSSIGYSARAGKTGAFSGNTFNINWTGNPYLWIDSVNVGQIATTSDYRVKKNVTTQTASGLERVMQLRPVSYELTDYKELFKADGIIREGFIAHEVQEVIPSGAEGAKDEENRIQNLRVDAILSVTVKAIQELNANLVAELQSVRQRLAALESKESRQTYIKNKIK